MPLEFLASVGQYFESGTLVAMGTVGGVAVTGTAAYFKHRLDRRAQQRSEADDVERTIARQVEAKVGSMLISLRDLELKARSQVEEFLSETSSRRSQFATEVDAREKALRDAVATANEQGSKITSLLERASAVLPIIEMGDIVPQQLLYQASSESNQAARSVLLHRILEHAESDASILELAGDMAKNDLRDYGLAKKLYQRAVDVDPDAVSARAEYLALLSRSASEREAARDALEELGSLHPNESTVINCLMNLFIGARDMEGLLESAKRLLGSSRHVSLLWRNIAVARHSLQRPREEVVEAFEKALDGADDANFVNTAGVYADYLVEQREYDAAEKIILRGLTLRPGTHGLHQRYAELHWTREDYVAAWSALHLLREIGDVGYRQYAERRLRDIVILVKMGRAPKEILGAMPDDGG